MRKVFTIEDLKGTACAKLNGHLLSSSGNPKHLKKQPAPRRSSKALRWLEMNLKYWAIDKSENLEQEYLFAPGRKYRADWALPDRKILIEYEGIFSEKSRHTSLVGYSNDSDKYRLAATLGFMVLRYTALNYEKIIKDLNEILKK